VILDY